MSTAQVLVTVLAIVAHVFSAGANLVRARPIVPAMEQVGVPVSWMIFPIGTLKAAGALGLTLGLAGVPLVGTAAATGLVLFWVCAAYTHVLAGDYQRSFLLATGFFLPLAVATLALDVASL